MTVNGGSALNVKGQSVDLGPGGVSSPTAGSATVAEVADPVGK